MHSRANIEAHSAGVVFTELLIWVLDHYLKKGEEAKTSLQKKKVNRITPLGCTF